MLLVHAAGSVKVGEVYRYTITYTPSDERVLPIPERLYLRIKNTAYLPLRAAYLKGPYTLYVAVRRAEFDPYKKQEVDSSDDPGIPLFEPHLKAGSAFNAALPVPESIRRTVDILGQRSRTTGVFASSHPPDEDIRPRSVTWIVDIASQIIFSRTASVGFEVLLGRNETSLNSVPQPQSAPSSPLFLNPFAPAIPAQKTDPEHDQRASYDAGPPGALSRSIRLKVQNTKDLWNTPPFPSWDDVPGEYTPRDPKDYPDPGDAETIPSPDSNERAEGGKPGEKKKKAKRRTRRVHLVILTHGLHSNVGADMLFMKEAIDEEAKKTAEAIKKKREEDRAEGLEVDDEEPELVLVRGYEGNSCRTERGIKYLGKHLAKYVVNLTSQSNQPVCTKKRFHPHLTPAAKDPSLYTGPSDIAPYKITSISFIGHSLGGLVQTYAIAYIQKHHPKFFEEIQPINFIALATPFLGLSNENPLHVRFALDFGLVGRTGQDLGLSWRAPSAAASAISYAFQHKQSKTDYSKPLLRILPTGPAHEVLKKFRNRTVYANVINDGIVPLRTSCLLYLDWKGLGKVEKARKENGAMIIGGLVHWGWGQLTDSGSNGVVMSGSATPQVRVSSPEPPAGSESGTENRPIQEVEQDGSGNTTPTKRNMNEVTEVDASPKQQEQEVKSNAFGAFLTFFRPQAGKQKKAKIYKRSQTIKTTSSISLEEPEAVKSADESDTGPPQPLQNGESGRRGSAESFDLPPRTTLLEIAGDILNPPLPSTEYIVNPASRPRTIFHDRVYHPEDIPPIQARPQTSRSFTFSQRSVSTSLSVQSSSNASKTPSSSTHPSSPATATNSTTTTPAATGASTTPLFTFPFLASSTNSTTSSSSHQESPQPLRVEEKIARAYHANLSWRKVLVRLEPDAHNNMIVRRMFANAYGWPVVRHVVETHFSSSSAANIPDSEESNAERALELGAKEWKGGETETIKDSGADDPSTRGRDKEKLQRERSNTMSSSAGDSARWTDTAFDTTDDGGSESDTHDAWAESSSDDGDHDNDLDTRIEFPGRLQHAHSSASTITLTPAHPYGYSSTSPVHSNSRQNSHSSSIQPQLSKIDAIAVPQPAHLPPATSGGVSLPGSWSGGLFWGKKPDSSLGTVGTNTDGASGSRGGPVSEAANRLRGVEMRGRKSTDIGTGQRRRASTGRSEEEGVAERVAKLSFA